MLIIVAHLLKQLLVQQIIIRLQTEVVWVVLDYAHLFFHTQNSFSA